MKNEFLLSLSKEELIRLIEDYSKNWLAMDGVWFQSVERMRGMDEAMHHDAEAWRRFTVIEAKRIKAFLGLPERPGLEGLARALRRISSWMPKGKHWCTVPVNAGCNGHANGKECLSILASQ